MAEALRIKISGDSSEFRGDIDKDIKKLNELSNKYKEVTNKLSVRGSEDFGKALGKALEKVNAQLDKAKAKVQSLEDAFNRQSAKSQEIWKSQGNTEAYQKSLEKQEQIESRLHQAVAEVNRLEQESANITKKDN